MEKLFVHAIQENIGEEETYVAVVFLDKEDSYDLSYIGFTLENQMSLEEIGTFKEATLSLINGREFERDITQSQITFIVSVKNDLTAATQLAFAAATVLEPQVSKVILAIATDTETILNVASGETSTLAF